MSNKKLNKKPVKQKLNPVHFSTIAIVFAVVAIVFIVQKGNQSNSSVDDIKKTVSATEKTTNTTEKTTNTTENATNATEKTTSNDDSSVPVTLNKDGDVVIQLSDITETATFYKYESSGTTMELFAVKASDGTVRTALNTCQVCNGSPKAYFEQQGDSFQCQNCGNIFSLDMIEQERGGCNPIPIMAEDKTVNDTEITIPSTFLDDNAIIFENWKKF